MKQSITTIALVVLATLTVCQASELETALEQFGRYEFGHSKKVLHDTRMAFMRGTHEQQQRLSNEKLLQTFIQSDATLIARREACMWLSDLATEASRPMLTQLAKQKDFVDVAQIALDALDGNSVIASPVTSPGGVFKAKVLGSTNKAELLQQALKGECPVEAREAFLLIAQGVETKAATAWLAQHVAELTEARQMLAMNVMLQLDAAETESVVRALSNKGKGSVRLAAISRFVSLAELEAFVFGSDPALAVAAKQALISLPASEAGPFLVSKLKSADPAVQAVAIEIAAARADAFASEALQTIAGKAGSPNQTAAIRALGKAGDVKGFERMLGSYVAAEGQPVQKVWQAALWDMSRRQPDYAVAVKQIETIATKVPAASANWLRSMAGKLAGMQPAASVEHVRDPMGVPVVVTPAPKARAVKAAEPTILIPGSYRDIVPKRFEVAAYMNCGVQKKVMAKDVSIACLGGQEWNNAKGTDPSLSLLFAGTELEFSISGLSAGEEYLLGTTWWDHGFNGRTQSIWINGMEVLPSTRVIAYDEHRAKKGSVGKPTPARIQFVLLPEHIQNGTCKVTVKRTGPANAVTSEIWVAKRTQPKAEKQVLLISGQDFPGHHWRKTGPVMEKIVIEDPRLEVTICETPYVLGLKHLDAYDVVFVHFKNYKDSMPSSKEMQDNLKSFVMNGGGMCMSHFACGAFMEWPEFVNLSGRIWSRGGHDRRGPFTVNVVDQTHPVTRGLGKSFTTDDELYWCLTGDPKIHLLCDAMSTAKKAKQPQALVFEPGKGRTFHCTLGHDVKAYDADEVRRLYRQGAAWAAGLQS